MEIEVVSESFIIVIGGYYDTHGQLFVFADLILLLVVILLLLVQMPHLDLFRCYQYRQRIEWSMLCQHQCSHELRNSNVIE